MATIDNLGTHHLSDEQLTTSNEAISLLEKNLSNIFVNLSPEERSRLGSINEKNKLLVNKVHDYAQHQPELRSPDVDWQEFESDFKDRMSIESLTARLNRVIDGLQNAKMLHDYDNYQAALDDYAYAKYKTETHTPGYETKRNDLHQFFPNSNKKRKKADSSPADDSEEQNF